VTDASGSGKVESFTVLYGRKGDVEHGVVVLRTADDARALARVAASDTRTLSRLTDMDRTPVGTLGSIRKAGDGILEWTAG
jgi:acetyl-CoA C-acetyltransferase